MMLRAKNLNGNYELENNETSALDHKQDSVVSVQTQAKSVRIPRHNKAEDRDVLIRLFGDKTVAIRFNNNDTVATVKRQIEDISGYPAKFITLKYGKHTITSDRLAMKLLNITNGDTLHAITYNTNLSTHNIYTSSTPSSRYTVCVIINFNLWRCIVMQH